MLKIATLFAALVVALSGCAQETTAENPEAQPEEQAPVVPAQLAVTAVEYEFQGIPETLEAGDLTFNFENAGQEQHQISLSRITGDQTVEELIELPEKQVDKYIESVGEAFAKPGQSDSFDVGLEPGRYGYVCFVPAPDKTPHAFLGMRGEFTVA